MARRPRRSRYRGYVEVPAEPDPDEDFFVDDASVDPPGLAADDRVTDAIRRALNASFGQQLDILVRGYSDANQRSMREEVNQRDLDYYGRYPCPKLGCVSTHAVRTGVLVRVDDEAGGRVRTYECESCHEEFSTMEIWRGVSREENGEVGAEAKPRRNLNLED